MDLPILIMGSLAVILMFVAYQRGDGTLTTGLKSAAGTFVGIVPLLIAAFIVAGLVQELVPQELISSWLGRESGLRGIFIAAGLGAITPGGPFVSFPLVATLYKSGAGVGPVVAFITAWSLWAITRLPLEVALVGPHLTLIRLASTLIFPPLAGVIANMLFR